MKFDRQRYGKNFARGKTPPGKTNKTEARYGEYLEQLKRAGEVLWYKFEGVKLRLADNTFYTPDFCVMAADGVIECHEVKGFWAPEGRVKIKVAADLYPFGFWRSRPAPRKPEAAGRSRSLGMRPPNNKATGVYGRLRD
jgi:hypothetical protein